MPFVEVLADLGEGGPLVVDVLPDPRDAQLPGPALDRSSAPARQEGGRQAQVAPDGQAGPVVAIQAAFPELVGPGVDG